MSIILDHKLIFIHVPTTNKPQNFFGTPNDSSFRPFFSLLGTWLFSYGRNWTVAYSCYNGDLSVCLQPSSWCWQWGIVVGHCISWKFRGASVTPPLVRSVHALTSCLHAQAHMHTLTHTLHTCTHTLHMPHAYARTGSPQNKDAKFHILYLILSDFNIHLISNLRLHLWHYDKNEHDSVHCV